MTFHWIGKSADGKTVTLKRLEAEHFQFPKYFNSEWEKQNADHVRMGVVLDTETTGLSHETDKVIEIGVRQFKFNRATGEILSFQKSYSAFNDPGFPLSEEVKLLTGITDEMVKDQKIDWSHVNELLHDAKLVVAHNAAFDRPFLDQATTISAERIWGCSLNQINWAKKGYSSSKLEYLGIYHGFFNDNHRALSDADSLLYLLSLPDQTTQAPYFLELMNNARKPVIHMIASEAPFAAKDLLKNKQYRWDAQNRYWNKMLSPDEFESELGWLEKMVYGGNFRGRYTEIQPVDQFKV